MTVLCESRRTRTAKSSGSAGAPTTGESSRWAPSAAGAAAAAGPSPAAAWACGGAPAEAGPARMPPTTGGRLGVVWRQRVQCRCPRGRSPPHVLSVHTLRCIACKVTRIGSSTGRPGCALLRWRTNPAAERKDRP
eukprot:1574469-Pyramimonas_sp.AAC.1